MWQFSNAHHRPSLIIESTTSPLPMRRPSRTRGSRYGQLLIDSMPPATATSMSPTRIALVREHHRLQPGSADLVDRERGDVVRQAAVERRLARRVLAEAGRDDVAHDAFVDDRRVDAGAAHGLGDDQRAELRRGEALERAEELAGRRPHRADDDGLTHGATSMRSTTCRAPSKVLQPPQDDRRRAHDFARPLRAGAFRRSARVLRAVTARGALDARGRRPRATRSRPCRRERRVAQQRQQRSGNDVSKRLHANLKFEA